MARALGVRIRVLARLRLLLVAFAAGSAIIIFSSLLAAQSREENAALCKDSYPEVRINACTVLILSGQETAENLARDYFHRGRAYRGEGDYDLAIMDFDQAIRLNPSDPVFFTSRGFAYRNKGDMVAPSWISTGSFA